MPANMSEMCRGGGARCGTRFSWRVGVLWSKLAAHLCCHLQDGVIWRGRPPTRSLPNHAHHQGQERSHKPEAATHDGNRWHTRALKLIKSRWDPVEMFMCDLGSISRWEYPGRRHPESDGCGGQLVHRGGPHRAGRTGALCSPSQGLLSSVMRNSF